MPNFFHFFAHNWYSYNLVRCFSGKFSLQFRLCKLSWQMVWDYAILAPNLNLSGTQMLNRSMSSLRLFHATQVVGMHAMRISVNKYLTYLFFQCVLPSSFIAHATRATSAVIGRWRDGEHVNLMISWRMITGPEVRDWCWQIMISWCRYPVALCEECQSMTICIGPAWSSSCEPLCSSPVVDGRENGNTRRPFSINIITWKAVHRDDGLYPKLRFCCHCRMSRSEPLILGPN
jgi:hypothetical protein